MMLKEKLTELPLQVGILAGTFILFLLATFLIDPKSDLSFLAPLLGLAIAIEIFVFVAMEIKQGATKHGWKHEVLDTVIALIVAVAVWFGASFILNTSTPISAVVSCSMLPNLERGDFVIVQGTELQAYEISMTQEELDSLDGRAAIFSGGEQVLSDPGSMFSYCSLERLSGRNPQVCQDFVDSPESFTEKKGAFTYNYGKCPITFSNGTESYQPCVTSVEFKGKEYITNLSNDIIVYMPRGDDAYDVGDIVHRLMFKIDVGGETYYLTRGDNNPTLDIQAYVYGANRPNHPVAQDNVRGKVIARIPFLGYFKLFVSGYFHEDAQCRWRVDFPTVS